MVTHSSIVQQRGVVAFPAFTAERVYMREFRKDKGLPADLLRWKPTVDAMLDGVDTDGPIYIMIDQGLVKAGNTQRRPGVHIDGYWNPGYNGHTGHRGESSLVAGHRPVHRGTPFDESPPPPVHQSVPQHLSGGSSWDDAKFTAYEGVILASNISACRAMHGVFTGNPRDGGDCSHIDLSGLSEVIMQPNRVYAGNVTMLHESMPVARDVHRTLVRLNVPGWHPN